MRLALLNPTYWPEVRRGAERLMHDLAAGLAGRGHDVTVLTTHRGPPSVEHADGVTVVRRRRPVDPLPSAWAYPPHLTTQPGLVRAVRSGFELVHAFHPTDAWGATVARRLGGPPVVFSMLGTPAREWLTGARHRLGMLERVVREAAAVSVLSDAAAQPFTRYLLREPVVIPGGVDVSAFAGGGVERSARPTVLCAASLNDPRKRGRLLLEAFGRLRRVRPDLELALAGRPDPMQRELPLELPDGARWIDADATPVLARAMAEAWATALPSVDEAFGLVLVESLAAGTPAVAARSGGCPEILDDSVGRLFSPDDPADLARALDEALDLGRHAGTRRACRERAALFDWPIVLDRYERLYDAARDGR